MKNTKQQIKKEIEIRNLLWKKSTPKERRLLVAHDIIDAVESGAIKAYTGAWCIVSDKFDDEHSLQAASLAGDVCECCAVGAVLLSGVRFQNKVTLGDARMNEAMSYSDIEDRTVKDKTGMLKLFGSKQLALMEYAFEVGCGAKVFHELGELGLSDDEINAAESYGTFFHDESRRIIMIMDNVLRNDGKFIPENT